MTIFFFNTTCTSSVQTNTELYAVFYLENICLDIKHYHDFKSQIYQTSINAVGLRFIC